MNKNIQKLYEDASLTEGSNGPRYALPDELVAKFTDSLLRDIKYTLRLNGYDDAANCIDKEFGNGAQTFMDYKMDTALFN